MWKYHLDMRRESSCCLAVVRDSQISLENINFMLLAKQHTYIFVYRQSWRSSLPWEDRHGIINPKVLSCLKREDGQSFFMHSPARFCGIAASWNWFLLFFRPWNCSAAPVAQSKALTSDQERSDCSDSEECGLWHVFTDQAWRLGWCLWIIHFIFQVVKWMEKAKVLCVFFTLVFIGKICLQKFQASKVIEYIRFSQPDRLHVWGLRELVHVIMRPLSVTFGGRCWFWAVLEDWKKGNITTAFRRCQRKIWGNGFLPPSPQSLGDAAVNPLGSHFQIHEHQKRD